MVLGRAVAKILFTLPPSVVKYVVLDAFLEMNIKLVDRSLEIMCRLY